MIYLTRTVTDARGTAHTAIAACETSGTVEKAEARGFVRRTHATYMAVWYWNDMQAFARMGVAEVAPLERAVGGPAHERY